MNLIGPSLCGTPDTNQLLHHSDVGDVGSFSHDRSRHIAIALGFQSR